MGLETLTATGIVREIAEGRASCEDVMRACLARVEAREHEVGAFVHLDPEKAMAKSRAADRAEPRGPMHGVPFVIKDIIDTGDMPTGWGFAPYEARQPAANAHCVAQFIEAGAIPLGKAVTTELAYYQPGKTTNPHNVRHTPGGSSSGTAAAVADFMAPIGFGSQTAGSVIRPASFCGVVGFKPSWGDFSLAGVMPLAENLDTLGLMARSVADIVLGRSVLTPQVNVAPERFADRLPRIGILREPLWREASGAMRENCETAAALFAGEGAPVSALTAPPVFSRLPDALKMIMAYEAARNHAREYDAHFDQMSAHFRGLVEEGRAISDVDYQGARSLAQQGMDAAPSLFESVDVVLTLSAPGEAPEGLGSTGDPVFNRIWTVLHLPCITLPFRTGPGGLPLSVQLIGHYGEDNTLLAAGHWAERVLNVGSI